MHTENWHIWIKPCYSSRVCFCRVLRTLNYFWSFRPRSPPTLRFARYCPYPRLKDICHDDVTTKWDFQSHNILYVLDGVITPLRITKIANPVSKCGAFWKDKEKTWTLWGTKQQLKTPEGLSKVTLEKSDRILWDLSSFEYGRLAEGIVSGPPAFD